MSLIDVSNEVSKFFDISSESRDGSAEFVLITGMTGAGKTTLRRSKYKKGYVNVDVADIYISVGGGELFDVSDENEQKLDEIGRRVAKKAIAERRNIVTEIIGASPEAAEIIIQAVLSIGYKVTCTYIDCDPVEAYKRHLNAVQTDKTYMSAHYCEPYHRKWILDAVAEYKNQKSSTNGKVLKWDQLSKVAKEAFQLSGHAHEVRWAEATWYVLTMAGLASYQDEVTRLKAILRFFALAAIYYDFFSIVMEEDEHEIHPEEWIDDLGVSPDDLRTLAGAALADETDFKEVLLSETHGAREEVYQALVGRLGGVDELFRYLYRCVHPEEAETDILNVVTPTKGEAYEWIEQGCEKRS